MRRIVAGVLSFTLLILLIVLILVVLMPELPRDVTYDQMCVSRGRDQSLLCGQQGSVLSEFMDKEIEETFKKIDYSTQKAFNERTISLKYYVKNVYWDMKAAARFLGQRKIVPKERDQDSDMVPLRDWRTDRRSIYNGGMQRYGVNFKNGRIVVPVTGTYYIYSDLELYQPFMHFGSEPEFVNKNGTIRHSMYKYTYHDNKEVELATALTPQISSENGRFAIFPSYISSLVKLTAGDEISVKLSNVQLIRHQAKSIVGLNLI